MSENNIDQMSNEMSGVIELVDDEGAIVQFEHIMTLEQNQRLYVVLVESEDEYDEDNPSIEEECVILRIDTDKDGNELLSSIDDEAELMSVFNKFQELYEDDYDELN